MDREKKKKSDVSSAAVSQVFLFPGQGSVCCPCDLFCWVFFFFFLK